MGFLGKLFGGDDASKNLEKARAQLERDPARALTLARRIKDPEHQAAAQELIADARERLITRALAMAEETEDSEFFEDAAEWIERALELVEEPSRRQELETRRQRLLDQAEAMAEPDIAPEPEVQRSPIDDLDYGDVALDVHYGALLDMLSDEAQPHYKRQGESFQRAYLEVLEGRTAAGHDILSALLAEQPGEVACHIERGRCRLLLEDFEGAASDFDHAWQEFGDASLLAGRHESAPGLWAEAKLASRDAQAIVKRLADIADPSRQRQDLTMPYAHALIITERWDEAERLLSSAQRHMPKNNDVNFLVAQLLLRGGDETQAKDLLESIIRPACAGGCSPSALHIPSLQLLIALNEKDGGKQARADELKLYLARATEGGGVTPVSSGSGAVL